MQDPTTIVLNPIRFDQVRSQVKAKLEEKKGELEKRTQAIPDPNVIPDGTEEDLRFAERLSIGSQYERDRKALEDVEYILEKIENGIYNGKCVDCQHDIDRERLLACPTTERCKECQKIHDKSKNRLCYSRR